MSSNVPSVPAWVLEKVKHTHTTKSVEYKWCMTVAPVLTRRAKAELAGVLSWLRNQPSVHHFIVHFHCRCNSICVEMLVHSLSLQEKFWSTVPPLMNVRTHNQYALYAGTNLSDLHWVWRWCDLPPWRLLVYFRVISPNLCLSPARGTVGVCSFFWRLWLLLTVFCFCLSVSRQGTNFTAVSHVFRSLMKIFWHDQSEIPASDRDMCFYE